MSSFHWLNQIWVDSKVKFRRFQIFSFPNYPTFHSTWGLPVSNRQIENLIFGRYALYDNTFIIFIAKKYDNDSISPINYLVFVREVSIMAEDEEGAAETLSPMRIQIYAQEVWEECARKFESHRGCVEPVIGFIQDENSLAGVSAYCKLCDRYWFVEPP